MAGVLKQELCKNLCCILPWVLISNFSIIDISFNILLLKLNPFKFKT
jgi:hypothetical protein